VTDSRKLKYRLTLQSKVIARGTAGQEIVTWKTERNIWCSIEPLTVRTIVLAQTFSDQCDYRIFTRYGITVDPTMRLVHSDGRVFSIHGVVDENEQHERYIIYCSVTRKVP
jgi:SPP1 family predicted phage head-tail adaptor